MESKTQSNELAMTLVEEALRHPEDEREEFLRGACGSNLRLFTEAWSYVEWEKRMQGFLLDPLFPRPKTKPPFEPGQILIQRFRIVREVAQGGMGIVWEAVDQKLDRRVALKCAKTGFGMHLPPEVRNARGISHPNVCKIFDIHTASTPDGEIDFISMEFLDGETLADRLHREPLSELEARAIARQLCAGLAEAHRSHLVHGDLKPNNVILTRDANSAVRAVLTDFGLARAENSSDGTLGGAPAYMAPELWKGGKPSVASDIYALGIILWELHSGQLPSGLGVASATLPTGERVSWKPPTGHGKWDRIIACCLHPDPAARYQSVTEIADAFGPTRLRKWLTAAAAMLFLAVVTGLMTYAVITRPPKRVRLALLPFAPTTAATSASSAMLRNTAKELKQLGGDKRTAYDFIPLDNVIRNRVNTPDEARVLTGASHSLRFTLESSGEDLQIHAYLTDLSSGVDIREWAEDYKPNEIRYAPTALAGLVTEALHLPPPKGGASVNAAARKNYEAGLSEVRQDKTVDQALHSFELASAADRDSAVIYAGLAEAQWFEWVVTGEKSWLRRSEASVEQAQKRNPDLGPVHRIAGLLQHNGGRYDRAVGAYLRSIELESSNGDAYRRLGQAYEQNQQLEEALLAYRRATEIEPGQYRNWRALGGYYSKRARYREALLQFQTVLKLASTDRDTHALIGAAYLNTGHLASAEKEFRALLAQHATANAFHSLGVVLLYERREKEAIAPIAHSLQLGQETSLRWMNLGTAYRRAGLVSESINAYKHGLQVADKELTRNPRNAVIRAQLAYMCARQNNIPRALSEIGQALSYAQNHADIIFEAAMTYEALGKRTETLSLLSQAPVEVVTDLSRWPDMADLVTDPRFVQMLALHGR